MKIAFVTIDNAKSILNWSGLNYYISRSLENCGIGINYIDDLKKHFTPVNFLKRVVYTKILHQKFPMERTIATAKGYSRSVAKSLLLNDCDCIFSLGTIPIAYLDAKVPKVFYTDATFACMLNYYKGFDNLSSDTIRQGHQLEKQALASCDLAIYSSDWAAQSAIRDYGTDPSKVKVVPFGANWDVHYSEEEVNGFINRRGVSKLKILFNGIDWMRKGGDLVLAAAMEIKRRNINVEVHIVGIRQLPVTGLPGYIINHGFLDKSIPQEKNKLENLYKDAHFLFVPSESEAFGLVFSEASLFGMPSVSRKTGGIVSAISEGRNGFTLDSDATAGDYADLICEYFNDYDKYISLALSSYNEYITRLNWKTVCETLLELMQEVKCKDDR